MDQATELRRAYATLGVSESATLEEARAAYSTWLILLTDLTVSVDGCGTERSPELSTEAPARTPEQALFARHELDLAWYAIEQAHTDGALFVRRARGCSECSRTPAVRITLHSVSSPGLRSRRTTVSALVCRDCGLQAVRRIQRANHRHGWWGVLGPVWNLQAITRNSSERSFLRRVEAPSRRPGPGSGGSPADPHLITPRRRSVRVVGWLTGLAAVAMTVGMAVPASSGHPQGPVPAFPPATSAGK